MGYITTEQVAQKRNEIKKAFPNWKFSIVRDNHSGITVHIMEADLLLTEKPYQQVNVYYAHQLFQGEVKDAICKIIDICNNGVKTYETSDYGNQPSFYTNVSIGKWDKPFKYQIKSDTGNVVAGIKIKSIKK